MILNDEQLAEIAKDDACQERAVGRIRLRDLLDTIADLQRQLAERDAHHTAVAIMLGGRPGAAQNAVREDFPQLAEALDTYTQQRVDEAVLAELQIIWEAGHTVSGDEFFIWLDERIAARFRVQGKPVTPTATIIHAGPVKMRPITDDGEGVDG